MKAQVLKPSRSYASGVIGDGISCELTRVYSLSDGQKNVSLMSRTQECSRDVER